MNSSWFNLNDFYLCIFYLALLIVVTWVNVLLARQSKSRVFLLRKIEHLLMSALFVPIVFNLTSWGWGLMVSLFIVGANLVGVLVQRPSKKVENPELIIVLHLAAFCSIVLLWLRSNFSLVIFPIIVLGVGDSMAALAGKKWGCHRPKFFSADKSLVGALTGIGAALVASLLLPIDLPLYMKATPALAMILEPFLPGPYDNPVLLLVAGLITLLVF